MTLKNSILIVIALLSLIGCQSKQYNESINKESNKIDSIFNKLHADGLFNGELLIKKNNDILIHRYYGKADLETNKNFTKNSIFEIASVSKPITVFALLKLVDRGKIDLQDKISKYIPELSFYDINVEQLVMHSSGLPDYAQVLYPNWNPNKIANNTDLLNILVEKKPELLFEPGSTWKYTNIGYTIIALIIERITNQSFEAYCKKEVFAPFNMHKTSIPKQLKTEKLLDYTKDFIYSFGEAKYIYPEVYPSFDNATFTGDMSGAQGICTNASDLSKFIEHAIKEKNGLSDTTYNLYISPTQLSTPMSDYFTTGWFYDTNAHLGTSLFYVGGFSGYRSLLQYFKQDDITVVVLSNTFTTPIWSIKKAINNTLANTSFEYPKLSYVRLLSSTLNKQKLSEQYNTLIDFDSTLHKFLDYEFDEYLEDLTAKKDTTTIIQALKKITTTFPEKTKYQEKLTSINKN